MFTTTDAPSLSTATVVLQLRVPPDLKQRILDAAGHSSVNKVATLALQRVFPDPDAPPSRQLDMFAGKPSKARKARKARKATKARKARKGRK